jgi:hypothetical protein
MTRPENKVKAKQELDELMAGVVQRLRRDGVPISPGRYYCQFCGGWVDHQTRNHEGDGNDPARTTAP